jgi:glycosyltransferase involved in cell wall biosynthesis
MSRFLRWLDRWTCLHADLVALDTHTHIRYFVDTFGIPRDKFVRIFVGAPEQKPVPRLRPANEPFRVVFQGKFTPLHGLEFMIEAASLLKDDPSIRFHFVGSGQRSEKIRGLAVERGLQNVEFTGWIESDRIPEFVAGMDLCLGIFGTSAKAGRVIPTKVFLALSLGKPVITGDTPAIRELLTDGESVALCPPGDPLALAQRIVQLSRDESLLNHIAGQGHRVFLEQASETRIGQSMADALHRLKPQRR